jgi:CBS domain-containing protein
MKVEAILQSKGRKVETTPPATKVSAAIHEMATRGIGALVVSSDGEGVEGVISERDIVRALSRGGAAVLNMAVSELMSRHVPTCTPDDTVSHLMAVMTRTRNRHLPVVEGDRLSGIVSIGDVVKIRLEELELETAVLRDSYIAHRLAE